MITITDIIISEVDKKDNGILLHKKVCINIPKNKLHDIRTSIKANNKLADKHEIDVALCYKELNK